MTFLRPMLSASLLKPTDKHDNNTIYEAMKRLRFPVLASLKMDGIRAIKTNNLVSRTLKPIPNNSIRKRAMKLPAGYDMELWNSELRYDEIESIVMSREHKDSEKILFCVLDTYMIDTNYQNRIWHLLKDTKCWTEAPFEFEEPVLCKDAYDLMLFEKNVIQIAGEGICFRTLNSPYKQGRSTLKEQYLVKLSRYTRQECTIIGFEEQLLNANSTKRNAIGMMDRSSQQSRMIGKGVLGAFRVVNEHGVEFTVGSGVGLTDVQRQLIWLNQGEWLGQTIVVKSKPHGEKIKPRSPIYIGKRSEIDI